MTALIAFFLIALSPALTNIAKADSPCPPTTAETYNSYQWNRDGFCSGSTDVDTKPWYEWWYFKVIQPETNHAFYFTYGVVNPWDTKATLKGTGANVDFGDFDRNRIVKAEFPVQDFQASYEQPWVQIGENTASSEHLAGRLQDPSLGAVQWDLSVTHDWGWNAMGWALFVRNISNIYWYPAQASAWMSGWIREAGETYTFDHAPAYQDRNWGRSMPPWWAWLVSSDFEGSPGTVLAAGGGRPKIFNGIQLGNGMAIGLKYQGKVYEFRISDADPMAINIHFGQWEVTAYNKRGQKIVISASAARDKFMVLRFKDPNGETFYDNEALTGDIHVGLYELALGQTPRWPTHWQQIANLQTHDGGIEYGSFDPQGLDQLYRPSVMLK